MQKLNKFNKFIERVDDESWSSIENDWSDDYSGNYDADYGHSKYDIPSYDFEDDDEKQDGMENIKYLLRKMFRNKGIDKCIINNNGFDIEITLVLNSKERLSDIVNIFDLLNKLKKDILPQYESEFDMWTNRKGEQVFEISFLYDDISSMDDEDDEYNRYTDDEEEIFRNNGGRIPF